MDRQDEAFLKMKPEDAWDGTLRNLPGSVYHEPLRDNEQLTQIKLPEEWEDENWDEGRERPKTVEEAKDALAERIDDPQAPDGEESRNAYDELPASSPFWTGY